MQKIQINQIKIIAEHIKDKDYEEIKTLLRRILSKKLSCDESKIMGISILKRSIDARKSPDIYYSYSVVVDIEDEKIISNVIKDKNISIYNRKEFSFKGAKNNCQNIFNKRPIVVGFGPAGMASAYCLAVMGQKPIVIERGSKIEDRTQIVEKYWKDGVLDTRTNVQFGEGGAGAFSDGKLSTGNKDKDGIQRAILKVLVEHGAPEDILYDAKPHLGTDVLSVVVKNIRNTIESLGGTFYFDTCLEEIIYSDGGDNLSVCGIKASRGTAILELDTNHLILAIGHSARDTFTMLKDTNVSIEPKQFAIGYRVAHLQETINKSQYGKGYEDKGLPPSSYKLTTHCDSGRNAFSFCMCPGGFIVNASSEEGMLCVNGMSYSKRDATYANSAIVLGVSPEEYGRFINDMTGKPCDEDDPLIGMELQRIIESRAYRLGEGKIPVCFLDSEDDVEADAFCGSVKTAPNMIRDNQILPRMLNEDFKEAMTRFSKSIAGYDDKHTIVAGIESRTSSPVRIIRDSEYEAIGRKGLYPIGEGAGYAGGIMSAAADGVRVVAHIMHLL